MEAILKFNLPDDQDDFRYAVEGTKWFLVVHTFDQYLRNQMKYNDNLTDEEYGLLEKVREELRSTINENQLSFE
jgi:hypothetical protein